MKFILLALAGAFCTFPGLGQELGSFREAGRMNAGRVAHTATLLMDGTVLIAGGSCNRPIYPGPTVCTADAELYDPATGQFTPVGPMVAGRSYHAATLLPDGRVLITGGQLQTRSAEIYDPIKRSFSPLPSMNEYRLRHNSTLLSDGRVLLSGGYGPSLEIFDPNSGQFTQLPDFGLPQSHPQALLLPNGKVFITGGPISNSSAFVTNLAPLFNALFDPVETSLQTWPNLIRPRNLMDHSLSLLSDGSVLIAGGTWYSYASEPFPEIDRFDFASGEVRKESQMKLARQEHQATRLAGDMVLFTGGYVWTGYGTDTVEIYDAKLRRAYPASPMHQARGGHTSTLLPDGNVLILGGVGEVCPPPPENCGSSRAELFVPWNPIAAPKLHAFSDGSGAVLHAGSSMRVTASDPAALGEVLELYLDGLEKGNVNPPQLAVGGVLAEILYWGPAPGMEGQFQINFRVPERVPQKDEVQVQLYYLERPSNVVTIAVR